MTLGPDGGPRGNACVGDARLADQRRRAVRVCSAVLSRRPACRGHPGWVIVLCTLSRWLAWSQPQCSRLGTMSCLQHAKTARLNTPNERQCCVMGLRPGAVAPHLGNARQVFVTGSHVRLVPLQGLVRWHSSPALDRCTHTLVTSSSQTSGSAHWAARRAVQGSFSPLRRSGGARERVLLLLRLCQQITPAMHPSTGEADKCGMNLGPVVAAAAQLQQAHRGLA